MKRQPTTLRRSASVGDVRFHYLFVKRCDSQNLCFFDFHFDRGVLARKGCVINHLSSWSFFLSFLCEVLALLLSRVTRSQLHAPVTRLSQLSRKMLKIAPRMFSGSRLRSKVTRWQERGVLKHLEANIYSSRS